MPRYVTLDLFGKMGAGKTTIFKLFAGKRLLKDGGNLSNDFRMYFMKCWVLQNRWSHSMVFLADPKFEFFWNQIDFGLLKFVFQVTNVLIIVTDSTLEDVEAIKRSFAIYPRLKKKLILFIIANMQDLPDRLSVDEIKAHLEMDDVLGLVATEPGAKEKVEKYLEEATLRYFLMLSKRGEMMAVMDDGEIGFGKKAPEPPKERRVGKYSDRIQKLKEDYCC